jgi:hypothetical protein
MMRLRVSARWLLGLPGQPPGTGQGEVAQQPGHRLAAAGVQEAERRPVAGSVGGVFWAHGRRPAVVVFALLAVAPVSAITLRAPAVRPAGAVPLRGDAAATR